MNRILRPLHLVLIAASLAFAACGGQSSELPTDNDGGASDGAVRNDSGRDAGPPGVPGVDVAPTNGLMTTESGDTAMFGVVLHSQPSADVTITVTSSDSGEGTVNVASLTFTSVNWQAPQLVVVTGVDDDAVDGDQNYTINLSAPSSDDAQYAALAASTVEVVNVDDESAGVTVTPVSGLVTTENGGTAMFTVVLNSQPSADVQIALASDNAAEGTAAPSMLTFTSSNWDAPQTVTVTGVNDFDADGSILYHVLLSDPTSGDTNYAALTDLPSVEVSNTDNDTAGVTVTPTVGISTSEEGGEATFTVVLNTRPTADVTIAVSSDDEGEGTVAISSITFTTEDWDAPQTVTVSGVDDDTADGSVPFHVLLGAAVSSDSNYSDVDPSDVTVLNVDNDSAGLVVSRLSGVRTSEAGGTDTFTVALASMPSAEVIIDITSLATDEGTVSPSSLTFSELNWNAPQTVTVTGVDDETADGLQTYTVRVIPRAGGDAAYGASLVRDVAVQNIDNDTPGITISTTSIVTTEAGGNATISVVLNTAPTEEVYILVTLDDSTEAVLSTSVLIFRPTNWSAPQTVRVTGLDDTENDGDQTYQVGIGPTSSADPNYDVTEPTYITGVNTDDEQPGLNVTHSATTTTEIGGSFTFSVRLNTIPRGGVNVGITTPNGDEVAITPSTLHFEPDGASAWNIDQTVTVRGLSDGFVDGDQPFTIRTAITTSDDPDYMAIAGAVGMESFTGTNIDYDLNRIFVSPTSGVETSEDGRTADFFISVSAAPHADVTVSCHSTNEAEGVVLNPTVTITPTNWSSPARVTVQGVDDESEDGNVPFMVVCDPSVSTEFSYNNVNPDDVSLVNLDNESGTSTPGLEIYPTEGLFTSERGHEAHVTFVLSAEPRGTVTIPVSVDARSRAEGRVVVNAITFTERDWNTPQVLRIYGVDDSDRDGNAEYTVTLGTVEAEDPAYAGLKPDAIRLVNYDDEEGSAGIEVTPVTGLHTSEWGNQASFSVVFSAPPSGRCSYRVQLDNDREARLLTGDTISFDRDNWYIPQVVSLLGLDDGDGDGDVAYHIGFKATECEDHAYSELTPSEVTIVNWDDEKPTPGVVFSDLYNLRTTEAGREVAFYVSLRSPIRNSVRLNMHTDNDRISKLNVDSLEFTSENWSVPQPVTLFGMEDDEVGDVVFHIVTDEIDSEEEDYRGMEPSDVTVTLEDNDRREFAIIVESDEPNSVEEGGSSRFNVSLSDAPESDVCVRILSDDWTESYTDVAWVCFNRDNYRDAQRVTLFGLVDGESGDHDANVYSHILTGPIFDSSVSADDGGFGELGGGFEEEGRGSSYQYRTGPAAWVLTTGGRD